MTIEEFIKYKPAWQNLPSLDSNITYEQSFIDEYEHHRQNTAIKSNEDFTLCFIANKDDLKELEELKINNKLVLNKQPISNDEYLSYLTIYSDGFKEGYNNLIYLKDNPINIIERLPIYDQQVYTWGKGILRVGGYNYETGERIMPTKRDYFREGLNEGQKYKAIFTYLEHYPEIQNELCEFNRHFYMGKGKVFFHSFNVNEKWFAVFDYQERKEVIEGEEIIIKKLEEISKIKSYGNWRVNTSGLVNKINTFLALNKITISSEKDKPGYFDYSWYLHTKKTPFNQLIYRKYHIHQPLEEFESNYRDKERKLIAMLKFFNDPKEKRKVLNDSIDLLNKLLSTWTLSTNEKEVFEEIIQNLEHQKEGSNRNHKADNAPVNKLGRPVFKELIRDDYFKKLSGWFSHPDKWNAFVKSEAFEEPIHFNGSQAQLASIFIQAIDNEDMEYGKSKDVLGDYLCDTFVYGSKANKPKILRDYITKKVKIPEKSFIDVNL